MPRQIVNGALAFTVAGTPEVGAQTYVRLIADGVNAPTFSAMKESGSSSGYNNTAGIDNQVTFWFDGIDTWYSVSQAVNATAFPVPFFLSAATTDATHLAVTFTKSLNAAVVPAPSSFAITASGGAVSVSSISISGAVVTLALSRSISGGETLTVSYAAPGSNALVDATSAWPAQSFAGKAVTNALSANAPLRITARTAGVNEAASATAGYYDYTFSVGGLTDYGKSSVGLPSSTDGYVGCTVGAMNGAETAVLGLSLSSTNERYQYWDFGVFAYTGNYQVITSGSIGSADATVAAAVNDVMRLRRAATTVVAEISKDGGATWTTIKTWTGATSAKLYGQINGDAGETVHNLFCSGNWS